MLCQELFDKNFNSLSIEPSLIVNGAVADTEVGLSGVSSLQEVCLFSCNPELYAIYRRTIVTPVSEYEIMNPKKAR